MSINPATDIVLDVMRAADPARVASATRRLRDSDISAQGAFGAEFVSVAPIATRHSAAPFNGGSGVSTPSTSPAGARLEFEALILGTFISQIMPRKGEGLFDHGTGSDMWRSVLSDQIARQIAKSGRTGIADRLFATHPLAAPGFRSENDRLTDEVAL